MAQRAEDVVREGLLFLILLVVARLVLLWGLGFALDGEEFTDDRPLHAAMVSDPLVILAANEAEHDLVYGYPPLQPLFVGLSTAPWLALLPWFFALRIGFLTWEIAAWPFIWRLIVLRQPEVRPRRWLALAYIVGPTGWMSSVVMSQEETLGLFMMALVCWLLATRRYNAAVFACGLAVVVAKVFFIVPLVGLVLLPDWRPTVRLLRRATYGIAPILVGYAWPVAVWAARDWTFPVEAMNFHNLHSSTLWSLLAPIEPNELTPILRLASMGLCLVATTAPLAWIKLRRPPVAPIDPIRLITAMMLWLLACFYIGQPEYYLMAVPGLLVLFRPAIAVGIQTVLLGLPWAVNFFYGVWIAAETDAIAGKRVFLNLYESLVPFPPRVAHIASLVIWGACSLLLAWATTAPLLTRSTEP